MIGYVFAVVSSLFFSLYVVPRKISKLSPVIFSFYMAVGFSLSSIVLYLFQPLLKFQESISPILLWSVFAGVIWAAAFVMFVTSIDKLGLSRSNQWKNLQGPIAVVLSLVVLSEVATTNPIFALLAAIAIFLSALFFSATSPNKNHIDRSGIFLATFSAFGFGSVAVIQKYVTSHVGVYSQLLVWSISIALSLFIYILIKRNMKQILTSSKRDVFLGLAAGVLYLGASLFQLFSYNYLAASISFTIIQLNTLWTIAIGIWIFKEIDLKKHHKKVLLGFLFTIIGIILLAFARK